MESDRLIKIGVVGPCGSGKTTLVLALSQSGYDARHIAQEHSYVPAMWKKLTNPDILIFLDASYPVSTVRRNLDWTQQEYEEQLRRLHHARQHANLILNTDHLTTERVLLQVMEFLSKWQTLDTAE